MLTRLTHPDPTLFLFGIIHIGLFLLFLLLSAIDRRQLMGINLWIKPMKFALSIAVYLLTWPFLLHYFPFEHTRSLFSWSTSLAFSFEMICIAGQAARGQSSHFNTSSNYNLIVFAAMGIVIVAQTLFTAFIGILFFLIAPANLPVSALWGIRLGILISCIFALQGGQMASRLSHTVGAPDGGAGIPFLNWSRSAGDLRIAHFFGIHALQIIPLFAFMISPGDPWWTISFAAAYTLVVCLMLSRALAGRPLW